MLEELERAAAHHLEEQPLPSDEEIAKEVEELEEWEVEPPLPPLRVGLVVGCAVAAAGLMVGSLFEGFVPKVHAIFAGFAGIAIAAQAARRKSALIANLTIVIGIAAIGLILVVSYGGGLDSGLDAVTRLFPVIREARGASRVLRPPAEFLPGYRAIVGWLMGCIGFMAGWVGIEMRRPILGMLMPIPLMVVGAISVPPTQKLPVALAGLVLLIVGLAMLSSLQNLSSAGEGSAPGLRYELNRALKAIPLIGLLILLMFFAARSNFLFPPPLYDPVREAVRPKAIPLSQVQDRVLFQVRSRSTGPWRLGLLDVYDGDEWLIPAFAETELEPVPKSGVVDSELDPAIRADFLVKGIGGAVLPGLPNTVGIVAKGPKLAYDPRTGSIRLAEGQIRDGLTYQVAAAPLPTEEGLVATRFEIPRRLQRFVEIPDPPPSVARLISEAPGSKWEQLEHLRRAFLETVVAAGPGTPVAVPPSKVEDMLSGSKEGSPFEIVAAQAMLARWLGIPARIGYGFDGGEKVGEGVLEVRPRHGASWLEVWFPGFKWFPLIGSPLRAKANLSAEGPTNADPNIVPSEDIGVQLYVPLRIQDESVLYKQIQRILLLLLPILLLVLAVYFTWPALRKQIRRSRRRAWAAGLDPTARIEVAYSEWRDLCTDFGVGYEHETPLNFLDRIVEDEEHYELAWLVTRGLWGDMRTRVTAEDASAAEELGRALRRRFAQAQPLTLRAIAAVSRLSLKRPYAPDIGPAERGQTKVAA
ncbi:MAG TPA: transglutaminase domain-containing protein [Actinomycetota bacterium]|nr:transglutaminase domain-containing protein [Actinomycetota bacterium]